MADQVDPDGASGPFGQLERVCMLNLLSSTEERVFFKDLESRFLLVSQGFLHSLAEGRSLDEVIGRTDADIFSEPHASEALADEQEIIRSGKPMVGKVERETFIDRPDRWVATTKWPLRDERGDIIGTFGISRDVTAQIEAHTALAHQALHDPVTGLANRTALMDRLAQALVALEHQGGRIALIFIDLDGFKAVNDTLGHDTGDRLLAHVGQRLQHGARRIDTVARLGGDEFVILCTALGPADDVRLIGNRIIRSLREPLCGEHPITVTGSLGAAVTDDPRADPGELLQQADFAMYAAKRAGRDRFELYDPALHGLVASDRPERATGDDQPQPRTGRSSPAMSPGGAEPAAPLEDPVATRFAAWIAAYEAAWRTPGTATLTQLFTDDATYQAAPFDEPLVGIEAIARFWEAERDGPDEVFTLTSEIMAAGLDIAVARLEIVYAGPPARIYRDLWIIRLANDGRCHHFEEWPFHPGQARTAS